MKLIYMAQTLNMLPTIEIEKLVKCGEIKTANEQQYLLVTQEDGTGL